MVDLNEALRELDNRSGEPIQAKIKDIKAYAQYSKGWIGVNYLYESPLLLITLQTKLGDICARVIFDDFTSNSIDSIINDSIIENNGSIDINNLVDKEVYIHTEGSLSKGYITSEIYDNVDYSTGDYVYLFDNSNQTAVEEVTEYSQTEPRSIEWFNNQLKYSYEEKSSEHGWVERQIETVKKEDGEIIIVVPIMDEWNTYWKFEENYEGMEEFHDFIDELGLPKNTSEIEGSFVYIHLIRNLDYRIRDEVMSKSDYVERFVISGSPIKPNKKTLLDKIKNVLLLENNDSVSVEFKNRRSRKAKSSKFYENIYDECEVTDKCVTLNTV